MKRIIFVLLLVLLTGCKLLSIADIPLDSQTTLILQDGDVLPKSICSKLNNVVVIEKTGCPACAIALPRLEALEKELNLKFDYYNTAVEEERNELLELSFVPRYVPTVIIDCKTYSGALEKENYKEIIEKWSAD